MNFNELKDQDVFLDNQKIAKVRDAVIDVMKWKVTNCIIELRMQLKKCLM